jgi:hypothetical protein
MTEYMIPARPGWEPLRVSISASWADSRVGALIGFITVEDEVFGLTVGQDGHVLRLALHEFTVDWRYDVEKDAWVDVNAQRADEGDQEV